VEVQVILRELREDSAGEAQGPDPLQDDAVRGNFEYDPVYARRTHARERALEIERLGRGERRGLLFVTETKGNGIDRTDAVPGLTQDRFDDAYGAGLPVGSSDSDQGHPGGRRTEETGRDFGERSARVCDARDRHAAGHLGRELLDEQRRRPRFGCGVEVAVAVGILSPQRDEEISGLEAPRVVAEVADRYGSVTPDFRVLACKQVSERVTHSADSARPR